MLDVFDDLEFDYYTTDLRTEIKYLIFSVSDMIEKKMMIETRTRYPSDKLTFTIADIIKEKPVRSLNIFLDLNEQFHVYLFWRTHKGTYSTHLSDLFINFIFF